MAAASALPPARGGRRRDWEGITSRLRKSPQKWLLIESGTKSSLAGAVRRGTITALRDPAWVFEVATRRTGTAGQVDVWMLARRRTPEDGDIGLNRKG